MRKAATDTPRSRTLRAPANLIVHALTRCRSQGPVSLGRKERTMASVGRGRGKRSRRHELVTATAARDLLITVSVEVQMRSSSETS